MSLYKNENKGSYHKSQCIRCGAEVTRRNSWAVRLDSKGEAALVLARDSRKQPITRKPAPRIHRDTCPGQEDN